LGERRKEADLRLSKTPVLNFKLLQRILTAQDFSLKIKARTIQNIAVKIAKINRPTKLKKANNLPCPKWRTNKDKAVCLMYESMKNKIIIKILIVLLAVWSAHHPTVVNIKSVKRKETVKSSLSYTSLAVDDFSTFLHFRRSSSNGVKV
jgi:hypothetical protein